MIGQVMYWKDPDGGECSGNVYLWTPVDEKTDCEEVVSISHVESPGSRFSVLLEELDRDTLFRASDLFSKSNSRAKAQGETNK